MSQSKNSKKINARIMKWMEMLDKGIFRDSELLIRRTRKGVPKSIRMRVWPELIKMKKMVQSKFLTYSTVLIKDSLDQYDINLDIPRTFSFQSQEVLKNSLFNVLKALSIQFPEVGYCQGMNFLVMRILQIMDDSTTFYLITYIMKKHKAIYDGFRNPGHISRQNYVFNILLKNNLPKVFMKLQNHNVDPVLYTPAWFLTLYSKSLQDQKFYRFFECFLVEGYCFMYKMGLGLLKLKEKQIVKNKMEGNLLFVPDMSFYDNISDDQIIEAACSFDFTNKIVQQIQNQYTTKHQKEIQSMQKQSKESFQKKMTSPRRVFQWSLEDFKKTEITLINFDE